jgi:hypothetical protein
LIKQYQTLDLYFNPIVFGGSFYDMTSNEYSSSFGNVNEDDELFGRFCETVKIYTDMPEGIDLERLGEAEEQRN